MNKFNEIILEIFNRYLLFEETYELNISVDELEFAFKNSIVPIYDALLKENKIQYKLKIPEELINLIDTNSFLTKDDILSCVDENWKFYKKMKNTNLHPIYIGKFDFSSFEEINVFLESITNVSNKELLENSIGMILKFFKDANRIVCSYRK